jgi:hypothetical protein
LERCLPDLRKLLSFFLKKATVTELIYCIGGKQIVKNFWQPGDARQNQGNDELEEATNEQVEGMCRRTLEGLLITPPGRLF